MSKLEIERSANRRDVRPAKVSSKGRGRPLSELVEKIERAAPDLAREKKLSSAAMRAGVLIRTMRKDAHLSQSELADKLGFSQARISEIEAGVGTQGPTWDLMERISAACGKTLGVAKSSEELKPAAHTPMAR
jgi:DNA-binding XRE family transcriptional regulator